MKLPSLFAFVVLSSIASGCAAPAYEEDTSSGDSAASRSAGYVSQVQSCITQGRRAESNADDTGALRRALDSEKSCLRGATDKQLAELTRRSGSSAEDVVAAFRATSPTLCAALFGGPDTVDPDRLTEGTACPARREETLAILIRAHGGFAGAPAADVSSSAAELRARLPTLLEKVAPNDIHRDRADVLRTLTAAVDGALASNDALCQLLAAASRGAVETCSAHAAGLLSAELDEVRDVIGF